MSTIKLSVNSEVTGISVATTINAKTLHKQKGIVQQRLPYVLPLK